MAEGELKSLLMKMKEESEKIGVKLKIQKTKIMACSLITSWQIDGETVTDFIFLGSKIKMVTSAMKFKDVCSLEEKLRPTSMAYSKAETTLPTKVYLVKAMVFPVVMYGCESLTMKKAEH